ncbi:nitric oxide reductase activation protein NorD [Chloracidobacterium aggregatum]|uniref:nitric oxide reductase activation protein NorD n=1 Tax=Chloracidobacterium aggregatum TaxID=2851959 RepID=UPI001B8ABB5D|nr:VWA domain-containing protein [Chloracidobacterium aggregatum]QUV85106.1 VWA domain-containing protein [Chloracidobacterium sp. 2]QUV88493.1 VWA domain-containing protein [Chloracidobacterium sp. S]QUV97794.1 VWA domain-containing protein [Chloracidobacterium sp. E]
MLFRTWSRLLRPRQTAPPAPAEPPPASAPSDGVPSAVSSAGRGATLGSPAAAALERTQAALERLSPQLAAEFSVRFPSLVAQLGEPVVVGLCHLLERAAATRHTARMADIVRETCQSALLLSEDEPRCRGLFQRAAPLYASVPLLGAAALRVAAQHPELTPEQFHTWLSCGLDRHGADASRLAAFIRLETTQARETLESCLPGLPLAEAIPTLRHYLRALTGHHFQLVAATPVADTVEVGGRVTVGGQAHHLALPRRVAVFDERERNFVLYKLLAAQGAGRLLFGGDVADSPVLRAAYETTRTFFADLGAGAGGLSHVDFALIRERAVEYVLPPRPEIITVGDTLALFPDAEMATVLFDVIEMARVLRGMRRAYRGVARDTEALTEPLLASRRSLAGAPLGAAVVELLFRLALVGQVGPAVQAEYAALTHTLTEALSPCLAEGATVADTLRVTLDIYRLLPPPTQRRWQPDTRPDEETPSGRHAPSAASATAAVDRSPLAPVSVPVQGEQPPAEGTASDAGEQPVVTPMPDETDRNGPPPVIWQAAEIEPYPEWDVRLGDYRPNWCRVATLRLAQAPALVLPPRDETAVRRLRRAFERWQPSDFAWVRPTTDGQELVVEALIERHVERRTQPWASDAVYAVRQRTTRSVAALLLLDVSRSTGEHLAGAGRGASPQRVLDGEIESVQCLAAALDQIGDRFAVYAFNSQGRQSVRCFQLKTFAEPARCLPSRLAALVPAANTRLGAAVRHATQLLLREAARSRLLLVVTDGLPQDSDYGDVTYAVADTAQALAEAQSVGVKPLGVALEAGQDEALLDILFGRGRYARIREAARLPEALPRLYRRWAM